MGGLLHQSRPCSRIALLCTQMPPPPACFALSGVEYMDGFCRPGGLVDVPGRAQEGPLVVGGGGRFESLGEIKCTTLFTPRVPWGPSLLLEGAGLRV